MQLCIEQLLYKTKLQALFVLAFFCPANIYRPRLGKVWLGRPNPKPIQPLKFYLRRKRKNPLYSQLYALPRIGAKFSNFIFIYFYKIFKNLYKKNCQNF